MKTKFFCIFLFLIFHHSYGQSPFDINYDEFSTTTSDLNNDFTNVDECTGTLNINIPLLKVESNTAAVYLSLNYAGSGIKVNQTSSRIGLGWNLGGIGSITRVVCGLNDNAPNGYYSNIPNPGWRIQNATSTTINSVLRNYHQATFDGQPDFFVLNFGNRICKFIKKNNQFVTFPLSGVRIEFGNFDGVLECFKVTDENGVIYFFTEKEYSKVRVGFNFKGEYVSSWMLKKIVYPNNQNIIINYSDEYSYDVLVDKIESEDRYLSHNECSENLVNANNSNIYSYNYEVLEVRNYFRTKRPIEILLNEHKIVFEYESREDLLIEKRLSKISHLINSTVLSGVLFNSSYRTKSVGIGSGLQSKRLMLTSFQKLGKNNDNTMPPTVFYYNLVDLPSPGTPSQDYSGFFNNKVFSLVNPNGTFNSMLPPTSYNVYPANSAGYYVDQFPSLNRESDLSFVKAMSLEKIEYSNGKSQEFVFELNETSPSSLWRFVSDGLRIKQIVSKSGKGDQYYTNFQYFNGRSYSLQDVLIKHYKRTVSYQVPIPNLGFINETCKGLFMNRNSTTNKLTPNVVEDKIFYQRVLITQSSDANGINKRFVVQNEYNIDFMTLNFGGRFLFNPSIPGTLNKKTTFKADGITKTEEVLYTYETIYNSNYDAQCLAYFIPKLNPLIPYDGTSNSIYMFIPSINDVNFKNAYQIDLLIANSRLKSISKKKYFENLNFAEEFTSFDFETPYSEKHFRPILITTNRENLSVEKKYLKYSGDFNINYSNSNSNFANAVSILNNSNRRSVLIESTSTIKKGQNPEIVNGSEFFEFQENLSNQFIQLKTVFKLKNSPGLTLNNFASLFYQNGNMVKSNLYKSISNIQSYSGKNNLKQITKGDIVNSFIYDKNENTVTFDCMGCKELEMAHTSFETNEGDFVNNSQIGNLSFLSNSNSNWPFSSINSIESMSGDFSLNLNGGKIIFNGSSLNSNNKFIIQFWVKNGLSSILANNQTLAANLIANVNGWQLFEAIFPGGSNIEISGNCLIDEISIFKEGSIVNLNVYNKFYENVFNSATGLDFNKTTYDNFGRVSNIYDYEGNIIKSYNYSIKENQ